MSRPNEIKKKIFYKYSKNLRLLFDCYLTTDIVLPEYGGYVCPIGLTMHDIDTLKEGSEHQLSLEHFPPKSLGGKNTCLIRKDINSSMGRTIDKQLLQQIQAEHFLIGRSSYPAKIRYDLPQLKQIKANFSILSGDVIDIIIEPGPKNMKLIEEEIIKKNKWDGLIQNFHFEIPSMKDREKNIALLRYAYLYAFSLFGYAIIFGPTKLINPHYEIIRRQILKPEEEIITFIPVIKNNNPPSEGLYIITHPEEMKSIMVTLSLTRNKITDYYSVFLPAPDNRGFKAYDFYQYNNINRIEKLNGLAP